MSSMASAAVPTCSRPTLAEWRQSATAPAADRADLVSEITATIAAVILPPGSISLSLTAAETAALPTQDTLFWDLELTAPDAVVTTILAGAVLVTPEITRPEAVTP